MDPDTFSGRILEFYGKCGDSRLFDIFHAVNAGWIAAHAARAARGYGPALDPSELATDIFCDIYLFARKFVFKRGPLFRRWVCVLSRNRIRKTLRDHYKRYQNRPLRPETLDDGGSGDPLARLVRREESLRLVRSGYLLLTVCGYSILKACALEQRVLRLHALEGLGYRKLAARLDVPLARVPGLVRRSRRNVARRMRSIFHQVQANALQLRAGQRPSPWRGGALHAKRWPAAEYRQQIFSFEEDARNQASA
jgi:DNA-directed RNA polymerase specialized sigma24 family protein